MYDFSCNATLTIFKFRRRFVSSWRTRQAHKAAS